MATLNSNALTSLDRTKAELDIPLATITFDDQVIQYINAVSDVIEKHTNRQFASTTYTHRFTGRGINYMLAKEFPITSITEVFVDPTYAFAVPEVVTTYTFLDSVFFVRLGESNFWPGGDPLSIQIEYVAGFTIIPDGLQQACIEWVRLIYLAQGDRRTGRSAKSKQGENISWSENMPTMVKSLIEPYQRSAVIARSLALNEVFLDHGATESELASL